MPTFSLAAELPDAPAPPVVVEPLVELLPPQAVSVRAADAATARSLVTRRTGCLLRWNWDRRTGVDAAGASACRRPSNDHPGGGGAGP